MNGLTLLSAIIAAPVSLLFGAFATETSLGLRSLTAPAPPPSINPDRPIRTVILMPAHNESAGIAAILDALRPALGAHDRVLVVADNCSDDTAAVARAAGADVTERVDADRRGKGYALDHGRNVIAGWPAADQPDVVIILDADCTVETDALRRLSTAALAWNAPVQAAYLMEPTPHAGPMVQISNFAFFIKNVVRQRGLARIGAPALLTGTGMAFPWPLLAAAPLASGNIVEDLALGVDLTQAGHAPRYLDSAQVWSEPAGEKATLTQRTRWEHGFIATARKFGLPILLGNAARLRIRQAWLGLHLTIPPLAMLFVIGAAAGLVTAALTLMGAHGWPLVLLAMTGLAAVVALLMAWSGGGKRFIAASTLARIPAYILWKIPVYLKLVKGPETRWVRTERGGD